MNLNQSLRIVVVAVLVACGKAPEVVDAGVHYPTFVAANTLPDSDPRAEGQYRFLYDAWGTERAHEWPPAEFMVALQVSEPEVFGNQFEKFGFIADPNDDLPVGLKRGLIDPAQVHENCAVCHVGKLPDGRYWLGAPNVTLDIDGFRLAVNARWIAAGHTTLVDALNQHKKATMGPGRFDASSMTFPIPVPGKFPPYYELSSRVRLNYLGTGRNVRSETMLSVFSFGAGDKTAKIPLELPPAEHLDAFLKFFGTITAPTTPQDATLVARGKAVFAQAKCDGCHHPDDPAKDDVTPLPEAAGGEYLPGENAAFPKGTIRTDPLLRSLIAQNSSRPTDGGVDTGYLALLEFIQDQQLQAGPTDGYRVGYLGGLWARAPYLHNGSVPTLEDLFKPAADRPKTFVTHGFTIDTTIQGNGNQGHEFGVNLSAEDKSALITYLNSL
jgi:hypothetical protein